MNNEKVGLGGFLSVYITLLVIWILTSLPRLTSDSRVVMLTGLVFLILYITSLVLILKRSQHAILSNKILLTLELLSSVYFLFNLSSFLTKIDAAGAIEKVGQGAGIASILFYGLLLMYWFTSKRVQNTFRQASVPVSGTVSVPVSAPGVDGVAALQRSFFALIILASNAAMFYTGWGILFIPVTFGISLVYVGIMLWVFNKWQTPGFTSSCLGLAVSLGFISLVLNAGVAADSPTPAYVVPSLMGLPSDFFGPFFKQLSGYTLNYLLLLGVGGLFLAKKSFKSVSVLIVVISVVLIALHVGKVISVAPELRKQVEADARMEKEKEAARIESDYTFSPQKIYENSLQKRVYSIFTPSPIESKKSSLNPCPYTSTLLTALVRFDPNQVISYDCLQDVIKNSYTLPYTAQKPIAFALPNTTKWIKKGDILVYTVKLSKDTYLWAQARGNAAKDCPCRMYPFDYRDVTDMMTVGTSTRIYEQSLVQHQVTDRERVVTLMYPINVDNIQKIEFRLSQFEDNPDSPVTLLEVSVIKPKFVAPTWLKEWSKKANPFL